jgi:hypothetical protein
MPNPCCAVAGLFWQELVLKYHRSLWACVEDHLGGHVAPNWMFRSKCLNAVLLWRAQKAKQSQSYKYAAGCSHLGLQARRNAFKTHNAFLNLTKYELQSKLKGSKLTQLPPTGLKFMMKILPKLARNEPQCPSGIGRTWSVWGAFYGCPKSVAKMI